LVYHEKNPTCKTYAQGSILDSTGVYPVSTNKAISPGYDMSRRANRDMSDAPRSHATPIRAHYRHERQQLLKVHDQWKEVQPFPDPLPRQLKQEVISEASSGAQKFRSQQTTFARASLPGADFNHSDLQEENFQGADLRGANFEGANLRGANFKNANLRGAHFRRALLGWADLQQADLIWADLQDTDLRGSNLQYANLRGANLSHAYLYGADLTGADLSWTELTKTDFGNTNLSRANLRGTTVLATDLTTATIDDVQGLAEADSGQTQDDGEDHQLHIDSV